MTDKNEAYKDGARDMKAKSMEEKINDMYEAFFIGKDCFTARVSNLELEMRLLGGVLAAVVAPVIVVLVAKVFFGI
jgi:hypothetical protein